MRRMLVSRSSREKPSPLLRCVRTSSPSSTSTGTPRSRSATASRAESVDLPAPESPVNQTVNPSLIPSFLPASGRVQPALDLVAAAPAARTRVFARRDRAGAVGAADTRVAAVVQRVIRQLVADDVG